MEIILYRMPEAPGMSSVSAACIQAEAYLRMTGHQFTISICSTSTRSPTGQLPALEVKGVFSKAGKPGEFHAARSCLATAKSVVKDLDAHLNMAQRAEVLAFSTLVEVKLDTATEYSTWVESSGYHAYIKVAYAGQPFPLNYVLPWSTRREVMHRYANDEAERIYTEAGSTLSALADKLRASGGPYIMGPRPCSLDALLFGHLLFYRSSPSAAPALQAAMSGHLVLEQYVEHILTTYFATPMPQLGATDAQAHAHTQSSSSNSESKPSSSQWSEAAKGFKQGKKDPKVSAVEQEFNRKSWWWLGGVATAMTGYVLLNNREVQQWVQQAAEGHDEDDGGHEEDDDDIHEHNDRED